MSPPTRHLWRTREKQVRTAQMSLLVSVHPRRAETIQETSFTLIYINGFDPCFSSSMLGGSTRWLFIFPPDPSYQSWVFNWKETSAKNKVASAKNKIKIDKTYLIHINYRNKMQQFEDRTLWGTMSQLPCYHHCIRKYCDTCPWSVPQPKLRILVSASHLCFRIVFVPIFSRWDISVTPEASGTCVVSLHSGF